MVAADVLLAAGLAPLAAVHRAGQVWIIYLVALWESSLEQFFTPAERATVPDLVDASELTAANGASSQIQGIARLAGSAAGGLVAGLTGLTGVAAADAASFLLSALLLARIRGSPAAPSGPALGCGSGSGSPWHGSSGHPACG